MSVHMTESVYLVAEELGIGRKKAQLPLLRPARDAKQDFSGPAQSEHEKSEEGKNCELPLFAFETLATATDNFSISNKLGEGGFGHVYKVHAARDRYHHVLITCQN